jgi:predicted porin
LGASYTGPFTISAYYQEINGIGDAAPDAEQAGVGFALPIWGFTIKGQYIMAEVDDASDTNIYALGVDWAWNQSNTLTVAYYFAENDEIDEDETATLIISNDYAVSKRTTLYAQVALIDHEDGATGFTSMSTAPVVPGEKPVLFGVGISHNF